MEADSSLTQTARLTALNKAEEAFMKSLEMCVKLSSEIKEIDYAEMRTRLYLNLGIYRTTDVIFRDEKLKD